MFEMVQKRLQTIEIISVPRVRKICQTHLLARRPCVQQALRMKWLVVGLANEVELACDMRM